jgi:hypothetical protein
LYFRNGILISDSDITALLKSKSSSPKSAPQTEIDTVTASKEKQDLLLNIKQTYDDFIKSNNLTLENDFKDTNPNDFRIFRSPSNKKYHSKGYKFLSDTELKIDIESYERISACTKNVEKIMEIDRSVNWRIAPDNSDGRCPEVTQMSYYDWLIRFCNNSYCRERTNQVLLQATERKTKEDKVKETEMSNGSVALKIITQGTRCLVGEGFNCYTYDYENSIDVQIRNNLDRVVKDITIVCNSLAESGTVLAKHKNILYKLFPPKEIINARFKIPDIKQTKKISCSVTKWE